MLKILKQKIPKQTKLGDLQHFQNRILYDFDDFIFNELVDGKMDAMHLKALREQEHRYMKLLGADHVILACTELCYLVQVFSCPLACEIDSLQALHDAGIERLQAHIKEESAHAY